MEVPTSANAMLPSSVIDNGAILLANLKGILRQIQKAQIVAPWLQQLEAINTTQTRVVIGVIGATGSGKSSVINALVGEKQVIPTNCMRACTAVITEISFNKQPGPPWRAVVEFISKATWRKELDFLLGDVKNAARDINDEESEAGIAFAKISAVYPLLNKHNVVQADIDALMEKPVINKYLGSELHFEAKTSEELHRKVKKYIDSKEKSVAGSDGLAATAPAETDEPEYWPLVNRVPILGKAPVLRSGVVLVDLPGIADSNTARAAVAKQYLKNCAALWVVAPIIRAVDDKSARHLLGEGFKRQLHRDGTLSRITFICSKTDEIVISEARSVLNHLPEFRQAINDVDNAKEKILQDRRDISRVLQEARGKFHDAADKHAKLYNEEQAYRKLRNIAATGASVHPPLLVTELKKRALDTDDNPEPPKKTSRTDRYLFRASHASPEADDSTAPPIESSADRNPWTVDQDKTKPELSLAQITTKIEELLQARPSLKNVKIHAKQQKEEYTRKLEETKQAEEDLYTREWAACVHGRNRYSSDAIRADFDAGVRDLARQDAEDDDENFNPDDDVDADTSVAGALPVFCVSSQGYQKLQGRLKGEKSAACFLQEADTGVLALREHAFALGEAQMAVDEDSFLNEAKRLLTSFQLWTLGLETSTVKKADETDTRVAEEVVDNLIRGLRNTAQVVCTATRDVINMRVLQELPAAATAASDQAVATVSRWSRSPKDSDEPGMWYSTFKAVIRRDGAFANHNKTYNFGDDLLQPFMQTIDTTWAAVFNTTIRNRFTSAVHECSGDIDAFSAQFQSVLEARGTSGRMKIMFEAQVHRLTKSIAVVLKNASKAIENGQKDANRLFSKSVEAEMKPAYTACAQEKGQGCYARMKNAMLKHVEANKGTMFVDAADSVKEELERMLSEVKMSLEKEVDRLCGQFRRDCMQLISMGTRDFGLLEEKEQKAIIRAITQTDEGLESLNASFRIKGTPESATAPDAAAQVDIELTEKTSAGMVERGVAFDDMLEEEEEEEEDFSN